MRRPSPLSLVPLGLILAIALVGCGSSAKTTTAAAAAPTTTTTTDPQAAYTACLSQHGVTVTPRTTLPGSTRPTRPPGTGNAGSGPPSSRAGGAADAGAGFAGGPRGSLPPGVTQQQFDAARQACQSLLPAANGRGGDFMAYTMCLQQHGVSVPTTTAGSAGTAGTAGSAGSAGGGGFNGINRNDPNFQAANQACASLLPTTTTTPPTATTPTTAPAKA